MTFRRLRLRPR